MAIRFDQAYNQFIRNVVRNYNKRVIRAEQRGIKNLPHQQKVSVLKARYSSRKDLNRELRRLESFTKSDAEKQIKLANFSTNKWEYEYIKSNIENAKGFFDKEYDRIRKRVSKFPGESDRFFTLMDKIALLNADITQMDYENYRSVRSAVYEFLNAPAKRAAGYRGFLVEVENVMKMLQMDSNRIDKLMNKIDKLSPEQFLYMYDNFDIIERVYDLADSPIYGKLKLNTTNKKAKELIKTFEDEIDDIIKIAKKERD